ncbi:hypothetical protein [Fictibacillus phosphorivorans]|uniref:hypothetical protein n=1 Tax=Fictibacillus phosphorivorans TaxID=1221500 RepID=UPI002040038D|nr:hypothetical protein [Fictibacillus phosphorivorans]MCM3717710.1 hypothetical protein [Fictibacillus phosphorivorans]MCM3775610.1 hypothetical protein [Fictibacillus phosphorivorans]
MIRLIDGGYMCYLNGHRIKIVYKGNNLCELYLEDELQGTAPFDYVKKKLNQFEKTWNTSKVKNYELKEFISKFDQTI